MSISQGTADRLRSILVLVATIGTIVFNALAATGYVNGVTPEQISTQFSSVLTPAGYAFSIWSLIYLGMLAFSIYQLLPANLDKFRSIRTIYILSCIFNCAWILFWHQASIGVCLFVITALLITLFILIIQTSKTTSAVEALFTTAPFGLYAGWVTAATLVNLTIVLKYSVIDMKSAGWSALGCVMLVLAAGAAVAVRFKLRNFVYPLAIAWAATGIAVKQSGNTAIVVTAAIVTIICLILSLSFVIDANTKSHE